MGEKREGRGNIRQTTTSLFVHSLAWGSWSCRPTSCDGRLSPRCLGACTPACRGPLCGAIAEQQAHRTQTEQEKGHNYIYMSTYT